MIGREREQAIPRELAKSDHSGLAVVYGRRRVGKTFLVRGTFDCKFAFSHAGVENGTLRDELFAFRRETGFRGGVHLTFVTPYGVRRNKYWNMAQSEVTLADMFRG